MDKGAINARKMKPDRCTPQFNFRPKTFKLKTIQLFKTYSSSFSVMLNNLEIYMRTIPALIRVNKYKYICTIVRIKDEDEIFIIESTVMKKLI